METRNEVPCPACSEMILATAKKCKHCGEWIAENESEASDDKGISTLSIAVSEASEFVSGIDFAVAVEGQGQVGAVRKGGRIDVPLVKGRHEIKFGNGVAVTAFSVDSDGKRARSCVMHWDGKKWTPNFADGALPPVAQAPGAPVAPALEPAQGSNAAAWLVMSIIAISAVPFLMQMSKNDDGRCAEGDARSAVIRANYRALVGMGIGNPDITIKRMEYDSGQCRASFYMNAGGIPVEDVVTWVP